MVQIEKDIVTLTPCMTQASKVLDPTVPIMQQEVVICTLSFFFASLKAHTSSVCCTLCMDSETGRGELNV